MGYRDVAHNSHFFCDLVRDARAGRYVLPSFQRPFIWNNLDILALLDSLYRGYPIGTLLLWENWSRHARKTRSFEGCAPVQPDATLILDGQQRIQALLIATAKRSGYVFDLKNDRFIWQPPEQTNENFIPCHLFVDWTDFMKAFQSKYAKRCEDDSESQRVLLGHIEKCETILCDFKDTRIGSVIIPADKDVTFCREVFRRMNLTGKAMTEAEVFTCLENGQ